MAYMSSKDNGLDHIFPIHYYDCGRLMCLKYDLFEM